MKRLISSIYIILFILLNIVYAPIIIPDIGYKQVQAATFILNKTEITLYVNETYTLSVNGVTQKIRWSTSNKTIATVSSKGKIKGIKQGTTTITASIGLTKLNCSVTVNNPTINIETLELELGSSYWLSMLGAFGPVTWMSSDNTIASINKNGLVMGRTEGTAIITGTYKNLFYHCNVTVKNKQLHASVTNLICYEDTSIAITVQDFHNDETLLYEVADKNIVSCNFGNWSENSCLLNITPKSFGTTTITITSNYTKEKLVINITNIDKSKHNSLKLTAEEIYEKCSSATVQINTDIGLGSGFFIDNGKIITNYHVLENASVIKVQLQSGLEYNVDYVLGFNRDLDIAILSISTENDILPINRHGIKTGETIYAIGSSLGLSDTFTNGIITNSSRLINDTSYIQINAAITHGNSGGPLINSYGEVIGINTAGIEEGQNINFAISINELYQVSTGNPVSVIKFNTMEKDHKKSLEIYEDTTVSNNFRECQSLVSGSTVYGTIKGTICDVYKFTLSKTHSVSIIGGTTNGDDNDLNSMGIFLQSFDESRVRVVQQIISADIETNDGNTLLTINYQLPAGSYIILLSSYESSKDIPYYFKILY